MLKMKVVDLSDKHVML